MNPNWLNLCPSCKNACNEVPVQEYTQYELDQPKAVQYHFGRMLDNIKTPLIRRVTAGTRNMSGIHI